MIFNINIKRISFAIICVYFFAVLVPIYGQDEGKHYAFLIGGLSGSSEYREKFHKYLFECRETLVEKFHFSESNLIVLADSRSEEENFINEISNAENINFLDLAQAGD